MDILLTNNPMAARRFDGTFSLDFRDLPAQDLLKAARDLVHQGHKLHTHPLTGGTAPNGSPYVSIVLSKEVGKTDFDSVSIIEGAMAVYAKLGTVRELPEQIAQDFMLIDCEMLAKDRQIYKT